MVPDPALDFYNQSNRTSHSNWDFDVTGYLQRSSTDMLYSIKKAIEDSESQD
jgi:hypothetical protein